MPVEMFATRDQGTNYQSWCKVCTNAYSKNWKQNNKERVTAQNKRHRDKHRIKIKAKRDETRDINKLAMLICGD